MSLRNTILTVICSSLCACAVALADEPPSAVAESNAKTRVLLFRSGRALEGQIAETDTHYVVVRPVGKVEIAKTDVEFVADDLDDVYRYKLERINHESPDEHIRLAQWCLVVNLRARAIEELERCIELAANSTRAKALLENLRRAPKLGDNPSQPPAHQEQPKPESATVPRTYPSFQKELTPSHVSTFSVQIQPLLVRSCGTAGCHDVNHPGSLVLQGSSRPSQRSSQQNLRAVLAQIDPEDPELSPLLVESLRPHGTARRSPFVPGLNDPAYAKLSDWVRAVSGKPASKPSSIAQTTNSSAAPAEQAKPVAKATGKETTPPNLVYSNKPIALTPARARAGMTPTNSPADAIAARTLAKRNDGPAESPTEPQTDGDEPPKTALESKSDATKPDSKPASTDPGSDAKPVAKPVASTDKPLESYQPIDPFDPEIFNRQFAPR